MRPGKNPVLVRSRYAIMALLLCDWVIACSRVHAEPQEKENKTSPLLEGGRSISTGTHIDHPYFHASEKDVHAEWSYQGEKGPRHWGDLSEEYTLAKTGKLQSPIDFIPGMIRKEPLPVLDFKYGLSHLNLVYDGHSIKEIEDYGSSLMLDEREYELKQIHFHSPSEHTVNGKHYPMEMHLVHSSRDGKKACVVAVFIEEGKFNSDYALLWTYLPSAVSRHSENGVAIDAARFLPSSHVYYQYTGSLTTPPCQEGVHWCVLERPVELSKGQIETFRKVIHGNNRPVQPRNGREIVRSR